MSKELRQRVIFGLFFGLVSIYFLLTGGAPFACFILIMAVVAMFEAVKILSNKDKKLSYQNLLQAGICVFVPCISIIYLRLSDGGIKWCLWLFVLIWTLDVFAYFGYCLKCPIWRDHAPVDLRPASGVASRARRCRCGGRSRSRWRWPRTRGKPHLRRSRRPSPRRSSQPSGRARRAKERFG